MTRTRFPEIADTLTETQQAIDTMYASLHDMHRCIERSRAVIDESRELRDRVTEQVARTRSQTPDD